MVSGYRVEGALRTLGLLERSSHLRAFRDLEGATGKLPVNDWCIVKCSSLRHLEQRTGAQSEALQSTPNIATALIEKLPEATSEDYEYKNDIAKHVSALAYIAGADTVSVSLQVFVQLTDQAPRFQTLTSALALLLALAMYPEVQRKAQACIDAALGDEVGTRLPTWRDLERLPYISAIIKEVGRWHTVLPLG
jgi:Cytochrome P450